ncbi:hypothetical protein LUZ60_008014 [Juncus effusus]|nr:hypothetical protein LUZ60_008014 [Juncus effusus]
MQFILALNWINAVYIRPERRRTGISIPGIGGTIGVVPVQNLVLLQNAPVRLTSFPLPIQLDGGIVRVPAQTNSLFLLLKVKVESGTKKKTEKGREIMINLSLPLLLQLNPKPLKTNLSVSTKRVHGRRSSTPCFASTQQNPVQPDQQSSGKSEFEGMNAAKREALLKGGEQVVSVLQEMVNLLEDMDMDMEKSAEPLALEIVAQGVIGKRVDEMEAGFMIAIDYMINLAIKDNDEQRKALLEVIKQTVLGHLTKKSPPQVQVVGLLCQTAKKESRLELLRRVAAGGGAFRGESGLKVHIPSANLNDVANQADTLLETMEERPSIVDRKLLARLVLVREEAKEMMGGGILDERNHNGLNTLPEAEVNFLGKLVAMRPGEEVRKTIKDVMSGKFEGADIEGEQEEEEENVTRKGIFGRKSVMGHKPRPVRPGMFLETVSKVLGGIYAGNGSGVTAQHLEWVHKKTLEILEEMAY